MLYNTASVLWGFFGQEARGIPSRDQNRTPCIGRQSLNPGPPAKSLNHSCLGRRLYQNYAGVSLEGACGYSADPWALLPEALTQ